jgi:hypothetical protein
MSKRRLLVALLLFIVALVGISRADVPPPPGDALGCYGDSAGAAQSRCLMNRTVR